MSVQSLDRAFDILELLAHNRGGMFLKDIGDTLDLNKSTVHRLLKSLRLRGYIEQDGETNRYRLGLAFVALSSQYLNRLEIKTEAEPFLRKLSEDLGETVFLATLSDNQVVYLDKVERFDGIRRYSIIGQRAPVHCTSLGKSLILDMEEEDILRILPDPMEKITEHTLTRPADLLNQLHRFRQQGWTQDQEERERGVSCAAAPIRDYRGQIIAAISSAWEGEKSPEKVDKIGNTIKDTAEKISEQLGCPVLL